MTVAIDSRVARVDLTANDHDPEGERIRFMGTQSGGVPPGVRIVDANRVVEISASSFPGPGDTTGAVPGVYTITTYFHDGEFNNLVPSTLTLTVLPSPGAAVSIVKKQRRGRVLVRNDNDVAVRLLWGAVDRRWADGAVDVPAHGQATITVLRRSLVTLVLAGGEFAVGIRRHLSVPRQASLPPGLGPKDGLLQAYLARWVRKTLR